MSVTSLPSAVTPVSPASSPASVSLIITSTSNLTSDEKRELLFNIGCTLEIPIDDFNDKWWPLVTNIWTIWDSFKYMNGDTRKIFACCLTKHHESSTRQKEIFRMKSAE